MSILSHLGGYALDCVLSVVALKHPKVKRMVQGRKETLSRLRYKLDSTRPTIWLHASSLGEFEQGRPLIEAIRSKYPRYQVLLSFYSPSGYEVRHSYEGADCVVYFPGDSPSAVRQFLSVARPALAIFVKYDFWPVTLEYLQKQGIPTYVVSAIFRPKQMFFRWYGAWYRGLLHRFTHIFVQDQDSLELLANYGVHHASIAGDTRFDRVESIAQKSRCIVELESFIKGEVPILVVGSSWPDDEGPILDYMEQHADLKVILAPHEIDEDRLRTIEQRFGDLACRLSRIKNGQVGEGLRLLIVDCFGLLSSLYRYADIAYIGGGFGKGIHNTVEAAVYGLPIVFGPKYEKFREAKLLIEAGAACSVSDGKALQDALERLLEDENLRLEAGRASRLVVESQLGATDKIIKQLGLE